MSWLCSEALQARRLKAQPETQSRTTNCLAAAGVASQLVGCLLLPHCRSVALQRSKLNALHHSIHSNLGRLVKVVVEALVHHHEVKKEASGRVDAMVTQKRAASQTV